MSNSIDIDHDWKGLSLDRVSMSPSLRSGPTRFQLNNDWERQVVCEHLLCLCDAVPRQRVGMRLSRADQAL